MMVFDRRRLDRFIFGPPWSFNGRICGYQLDSRVLGLIAVVFGDPLKGSGHGKGPILWFSFESVSNFQIWVLSRRRIGRVTGPIWGFQW
ncbi:hypothetical protein ISN45_Aa01g031600 [Arabidopsis thaliana x Arabidopsis arenosa]|uniref:Uncharacterized protein n=1 Tax=Arabidopsis thaliana x Arabidopsis arenosa TaxID=1240361 RepID=A0A8T2C2V6_9BRAS|nr:hypothetical protein ISN45_Aa01g031600 [Arabidopsis thaliana x Arabidopsis arenosa]